MTFCLCVDLSNGTDSLNHYQPRQRREGEKDHAQGSSEAPFSWFDQDNTTDDRSGQETGQRSNSQRERPSYRQGIREDMPMNDSFGCASQKSFVSCYKVVMKCFSV